MTIFLFGFASEDTTQPLRYASCFITPQKSSVGQQLGRVGRIVIPFQVGHCITRVMCYCWDWTEEISAFRTFLVDKWWQSSPQTHFTVDFSIYICATLNDHRLGIAVRLRSTSLSSLDIFQWSETSLHLEHHHPGPASILADTGGGGNATPQRFFRNIFLFTDRMSVIFI